jgi:hypothetical protein
MDGHVEGKLTPFGKESGETIGNIHRFEKHGLAVEMAVN